MSISNELSSDLTDAMLAQNMANDPVETRELAAILAKIHSSLRELTAAERKERHRFVRSLPFSSIRGTAGTGNP
jgi:predicted transcriptional regulator